MSLSLAPRNKLKDLAVCLALGNVGFLERWDELEQTHARAINYFRDAAGGPSPSDLYVDRLDVTGAALLAGVDIRSVDGAQKRSKPQLRADSSLNLIVYLEPVRQRVVQEGVASLGRVLFGMELALMAGLALTITGRLAVLRALRGVTYAAVFLLPGILSISRGFTQDPNPSRISNLNLHCR